MGEGNSKKLSKKNSAIEILKILKEKFEPLFMISSKKTNRHEFAKSIHGTGDSNNENASNNRFDLMKLRKSKAKNIVKIKKTSPDYGKGSINPISRLIQIQQAKKEPEPEFTFIVQNKKKLEQNHRNKRTEFVIQVTLTTNSNSLKSFTNPSTTSTAITTLSEDKNQIKLQCEGKGTTKKQAKKNAAEAMLIKLGYQPKVSALKPSIKTVAQNNTVNPSNKAQTTISTTEVPAVDNQATIDTSSVNEKNEKRVTFVEGNNVTIQIDEYKSSSVIGNFFFHLKKSLLKIE